LGHFSYTQVPNGEAWLILQQSASTGDLGAGQTFQAALDWTDAASTVNIVTSSLNGVKTGSGRYVIRCERPYFATPGSYLGIAATAVAGGPIMFRMVTRFARFTL